MTSKEIRELKINCTVVSTREEIAKWLREIAAQLAEMNEKMVRGVNVIPRGPMTGPL